MPTSRKTTKRSTRKPSEKKPTCELKIGTNAITVEEAKQILGWKEETDKVSFGNKFCKELKPLFKRKIRLENNVTNRPLYMRNVAKLIQEQERGNWNFNGEPIILGKKGSVLNGQHQLIALVAFAEAWDEDRSKYPNQKKQPTLDKLVVRGVDEDDKTVNTMDTCKPRSLPDVIYRCHYFKDLSSNDQKIAARMSSYALKLLWFRSTKYLKEDVKRTHSEDINFLNNHARILEAVSYILEEDEEGKISQHISAGFASGMLYLMATSGSDTEKYFTSDPENLGEDLLDFGLWDKACEFFTLLASGDKSFNPVRAAIAQLVEEGYDAPERRIIILVNAWQKFITGSTLTKANLYPKFYVKDDVHQLEEIPILGGIDLGEEGLSFVTEEEPDEEEIVKRAENLRAKRDKPEKEATRQGEEWSKGDTAWVHPEEDGTSGESYFATLAEEPYPTADGDLRVVVDAEDGTWEESVTRLSLKQFEMVG